MRHRMVSGTGLGNPDPVLLDNKGNVNKEFADAAIDAYFSHWDGFDFQIEKDKVTIGIEPAYQDEKLKLLCINKNKDKSYIRTGKAWGPYGSQIGSNTKYYKEYKNNCKFTKFIDKWYNVLFKGETNV